MSILCLIIKAIASAICKSVIWIVETIGAVLMMIIIVVLLPIWGPAFCIVLLTLHWQRIKEMRQ